MSNTDGRVGSSTSRRKILKTAGLASAVGLAGCIGDSSGSSSGSSSTVQAAFIYDGPISDQGYTAAHDRGRRNADEANDWLETEYTEEVAPADVRSIAESYAEDGFDIIYGTTFGFMDPWYQLSTEYTDTYWENCTGYRTREPNMGRYYVRVYEARYLMGISAGLLSESNKMGFVGANASATAFREINAFVMGARSVNPDMEMYVRYIDSYYDPPAEQQAAESLLDEGCDYLAQLTNSTAVPETAAANGAWATSFNTSLRDTIDQNYANGTVANWDVHYSAQSRAVRDGNYTADAYWGGISEGAIGFDDWGEDVPQNVRDEFAAAREDLVAGEINVWEGTEWEDVDDQTLFSDMDGYVEGVQDSLE